MVTKQTNFYGGHNWLCGQPDIPGLSKEVRDGWELKVRKSCPRWSSRHLIQRGEGQVQCSEPGSGEDTSCLRLAGLEEGRNTQWQALEAMWRILGFSLRTREGIKEFKSKWMTWSDWKRFDILKDSWKWLEKEDAWEVLDHQLHTGPQKAWFSNKRNTYSGSDTFLSIFKQLISFPQNYIRGGSNFSPLYRCSRWGTERLKFAQAHPAIRWWSRVHG